MKNLVEIIIDENLSSLREKERDLGFFKLNISSLSEYGIVSLSNVDFGKAKYGIVGLSNVDFGKAKYGKVGSTEI